MEGERRNPTGLRATAIAFLPVVVAATSAFVVRLTGHHVPLAVLLAAGAALVAAVAVAAACATVAVIRRRWGWAAALLLAWPLSVPVYLWRRSGEPHA